MNGSQGPSVLLLDGDYDNTLQIAKELSIDLDAWIIGVGTDEFSRLFYSTYCDERIVLPEPGSAAFGESLGSVLDERRPDVVLPVGYRSVAALDAIRDEIPGGVQHPLPDSTALETAVDKRKTLSIASNLGIETPRDFTQRVAEVDAQGRHRSALDDLPFPVFLKARRESGDTISAQVSNPSNFWRQYDALSKHTDGERPLVQEFVAGDGRTYGCGIYFNDREPALCNGHVELRSVPRRGGSGTRLRVMRDPHLESLSVSLLTAIDWQGIALVEYRYTGESYVLMEVNPKFWASYALSSQCGYRFASTLVATLLDLPEPTPTAPSNGACERVFPLRELTYCLRNYDDESFMESTAAMVRPLTRPDINLDDLPAWLIPPVSAVQNSQSIRAFLRAFDRIPGVFSPSGSDWFSTRVTVDRQPTKSISTRRTDQE